MSDSLSRSIGLRSEAVRPQWLIEIRDPLADHALVIRLGYDGRTETGANYDPDRAAELFWEAIGSEDVIEKWCLHRDFKLVRKEEPSDG